MIKRNVRFPFYALVAVLLVNLGFTVFPQTTMFNLAKAVSTLPVDGMEYANGTIVPENSPLLIWYDWVDVSGTQVINYAIYTTPDYNYPVPIANLVGQHFRLADGTQVFIVSALSELEVYRDLNGDGIADIVFTARTGDGLGNGRSNSGEVYIILGGPSLTGVRDLSTASVDTVIYGPVPVGLMGSAVAIAELDEEGLEDLAIGAALASASGRSSNGAVYITYGGDLPSRLDLATAGDLFLYGAGDSDAFGSGLAVGDINGDGRPELIVAAPGPDGAVGKVYALELP